MKEKKNAQERAVERKAKELDLDDLKQVQGGGAFAEIPRVSVHSLDQKVRDKVSG